MVFFSVLEYNEKRGETMNTHQIRRHKLADKLQSNSILLLHSGNLKHKSHDEFYPFYPSMNFWYLTGIEQDNVVLMMIKEDTLINEYLFIEETTDYMRKWVGEKLSKEIASTLSGIDQKMIMWQTQFSSFFHNVMNSSRRADFTIPKILYLDLFALTEKDEPISYTQFKTQINQYRNLQIQNINELLYPQRMIKDDMEIASLKQAISITNKGLQRLMKELPTRDNEGQLDADFTHQVQLEGATELSFKTIAASGENATVLHYEENNSPLFQKDLILFDLGAKFNYYSADISRTYPISGTFTNRQKQIYELVLLANKESIKAVKAGVTWGELNKVAKDILTEGAMRLGIITEPKDIGNYYYHSVGHFLGLDTHDVGGYGVPLEEGMVITIEPGLYIKEEQIGVRIEDNVLVTKNGCENLSKEIIKEVDDIEQYMKK